MINVMKQEFVDELKIKSNKITKLKRDESLLNRLKYFCFIDKDYNGKLTVDLMRESLKFLKENELYDGNVTFKSKIDFIRVFENDIFEY